MVKCRTRKRHRGGTTVVNQNKLPFTPILSRKQQYPQLAPSKRKQPLSRTNYNGQSVRNLTKFFEEQALQPLPIIYGHTQNNKPNIAKKSINQMPSNKNVRHLTIKQSKANTVHKTNKLMSPKQIAILTRKNNPQKQNAISILNVSQPQKLKQLPPTQLKTATRRNNRKNNIKQRENIWNTENAQQININNPL